MNIFFLLFFPVLASYQIDILGSNVNPWSVQRSDRPEAIDAKDFLTPLTNIQVSDSGTSGLSQFISVNGLPFEHSLVLVDGVVMNDLSAVNGAFDISILDGQEIEKIEVITGARTLSYSEGGIGGVILITTKSHHINPNLYLGASSSQQFRRGLGLGFETNKNIFSLGFSGAAGGDTSSASGGSEVDLWRKGSTRIKNQLNMAELGFLNFGYSMRHKKADFDSFTSTAVDDANATTSSAARTLYTHWNLDLKKTSLKLNWDYQLSKRHESNPSPSPDFSYEYEYISDRQNLGFSIQQTLFDDHNFNLFLNHYFEKYIQQDLIPREGFSQSRRGIEYGGSYRLPLENNTFAEVLLRNNCLAPSNDCSTGSGFMFGLEAPGEAQDKLEFSYLNHNKRPSLYQLLSPYGNVNLATEKSKSYHLDWGRNHWSFSAAIYQLEDQIQYLQSYTNIARSQILSLGGKLLLGDRLNHNLSVTYLEPRDKTTNTELLRRSRWQGRYQYNWMVPTRVYDFNYILSPEIRYKSSQQDINDQKIEASTVYDVRLQASQIWGSIGVWGHNVFNTAKASASGYSAEPVQAGLDIDLLW